LGIKSTNAGMGALRYHKIDFDAPFLKKGDKQQENTGF